MKKYFLLPSIFITLLAACAPPSTATPSPTPPATATSEPTEQACTVNPGESLLSTPGGTESIAIDNDGNIYTTDSCNGQVFRIQPDGSSSVLATLPYVEDRCLSASIGITISDDGNLHIVVLSRKPEYNGVWRVGLDGAIELEFPLAPEEVPNPNDLAFDSAGTCRR